jgi:hypothetical protein
MEFTTRMVTSSEGLSQEEALLSLQEHPRFMDGTRVASIYNQGGRWVAKLLEPKTANEDVEPCEHCQDKGCQHCKKTAAGAFEDIDESPAELHEEKHEEHEKSESPLEELEEHEGEDHEDSEEKKIKELEKKIDLLLDALGISEKNEEPKVPEAPAADLPAAPAPKGGPIKSEPLPPGSGAKLKPGEVPNKPGMTPVGAPAFASVKTAGCEGSCDEGSCEHCDKQRKKATSVPPNAANMNPNGGTPTATGPTQSPCAKCGGTDPHCTQCSGAKVASFVASKFDKDRVTTIRQAKASLENQFKGFRVARIKRDGDYIHALISR